MTNQTWLRSAVCLSYLVTSTLWPANGISGSLEPDISTSTISEIPLSQPAVKEQLSAAPVDASERTAARTGVLPESSYSLGASALLLPIMPVTLNFQDADIRDVLQVMSIKSGLNIIYGQDVIGTITLHLEKVPFDQAFQTVMTLKNLVVVSMSPQILRVVTSQTLSTEQSQAISYTRVFRLNYANAAEVKKQLQDIRTSSGRKSVISVDSRMNALVVTDTKEGLLETEKLLSAVDHRPEQVLIEAKILEVQTGTEIDLGVTWGVANTQTKGANTYTIGSSDINTKTAFSGNNPLVTANRTGYTEDATSPTFERLANKGGEGAFLPIPGTGVTSLGAGIFSFGILSNTSLLNATISALETKNKLKTLSKPSIVTLNNEEATVLVGSKIPYAVTTNSPGVGSTQSYQFVDAGVKLTVTPTINSDGQVLMKIHPEVSIPLAGPVGTPPTINTRETTTTVLVPDNQTLAIGGLISEQEQKIASQVPVLGSIPILGVFFRNTTSTKSKTELIVFITPKIIRE